jgi:hypothetical protein
MVLSIQNSSTQIKGVRMNAERIESLKICLSDLPFSTFIKTNLVRRNTNPPRIAKNIANSRKPTPINRANIGIHINIMMFKLYSGFRTALQ